MEVTKFYTAETLTDDMMDATQYTMIPPAVSKEFLDKMLFINRICLIVIGTLSIVFNTFNLMVYARHKILWTTPNVMLINLSVSDLMMGISLILFVTLRYIQSDVILRYTLMIAGFSQTTAVYMSILCIVTISLERWLAVTFPLFYKVHFTLKEAYGLAVATWMYGLIMGGFVPVYYLWRLPDEAYRLVIHQC